MQELTTKSERRISSSLLAIATVSVLLLSFLGLEGIGHCDDIAQQCNNNDECIIYVKKALLEKEIADLHARQDDSQKEHYQQAAKLYYSAYKEEPNHNLLMNTCYLVELANSGTNDCASKRCYMKLLKLYSDTNVVKTYKDTIDRILASCTAQEAKQNVPLMNWSGTFKPGFSASIYLKNGEKPLHEYVNQVEAEKKLQLKREFPHHYRTEIAGMTLFWLGFAGGIGGLSTGLIGTFFCNEVCTVNSPPHLRAENLRNVSAPIIGGSVGFAAVGGLLFLAPNLSKKYNDRSKLTIPIYQFSGEASVPE